MKALRSKYLAPLITIALMAIIYMHIDVKKLVSSFVNFDPWYFAAAVSLFIPQIRKRFSQLTPKQDNQPVSHLVTALAVYRCQCLSRIGRKAGRRTSSVIVNWRVVFVFSARSAAGHSARRWTTSSSADRAHPRSCSGVC